MTDLDGIRAAIGNHSTVQVMTDLTTAAGLRMLDDYFDALVAENERLTYYEFAWRDDFDVVKRDERARIAEAVRGLPHAQGVVNEWLVDRAAVLALVEGV
jgi:hypothetical protein